MAFQRGNTAGRDNTSGRFVKGVSGNPGGMPKAIVEVAKAAREHTVEMLEVLLSIARDKAATASARVSAAQYVVDRGWGRAPQTIDIRRTTELGNLTDDELLAIAAGEVAEPNGGDFTAGSPESPDKPN